MWDRLSPERIFLLVALPVGLVLLALIPPLAGGNETHNFRRVAGIVSGEILVAPVSVPGGVNDVLTDTNRLFPEGRSPPYRYRAADWEKVAAVELQRERPSKLMPNPIAVLHPVSYIPQIAAVWVGERFDARPLTLFYLGRLGGFLAGLTLTFLAIRVIPFQRASLAGIALLPPMLFSRSTFDADQLTNGLAFCVLALLIREIVGRGPLPRSRIWLLAIGAALLAQCKSAYLLLPLLCVAIPEQRFGSRKRKLIVCATIVVPGTAASLAWMVTLRATFFSFAVYRTWSGIVVPGKQSAMLVEHPVRLAIVIARTVLTTQIVPRALLDFLGTFGPPVMVPLFFFPLLAIGLSAILLTDHDAHGAARTSALRLLVTGIVGATLLLILTLLYFQWTRLGGTVVDGFSGRYLFPLTPLLLIFARRWRSAPVYPSAKHWLVLLAMASSAATIWTTWATYWA